MTTPAATPTAPDLPTATVADPRAWRGYLLGLLLLGVAFAPTLIRTVGIWWNDPEYSHGFLMPLVALWLVRIQWHAIRALRGATSLLSIPLLLFCVLAMLAGELDFVISLSPFALVGGIAALTLAFFGWSGLRLFVPALVALALACPLPGFVQQAITVPLKETSSRLAVGMLQVSGIPTILEGSVIHLEGADSLWVAEACSGIRSLISLVSLAIVACLVWQRKWVVKVLVILAAVPIAVFVNGFRIWLTGYLSVHAGPGAAEGALHLLEGFVLFAFAGLLLLGFALLMRVLFPEARA